MEGYPLLYSLLYSLLYHSGTPKSYDSADNTAQIKLEKRRQTHYFVTLERTGERALPNIFDF